jgi:hypothetical protein
MIQEITKRFELVVKNLDELYSVNFKDIQNLNDLELFGNKVAEFAYSETSNLNIFDEMLCAYLGINNLFSNKVYELLKEDEGKKIKTPPIRRYVYKCLYRDLTDILKNNLSNKKFSYFNYKEYYSNRSSLASFSSLLIIPQIIPNTIDVKDGLIVDAKKKNKKKANLIQTIEDDFNKIEKFINDILFYNIKMNFDDSESNLNNDIITIKKDYKKEYFDSWVNETIDMFDWKKKSDYDLWNVVYDYTKDYEIHGKIEKHQEKLFMNFVNYLVIDKLSEITESPKENFKKIIENELSLFQKFIAGDTSEMTIKRIDQIISLYLPEKVLLQYDEILKSSYFNNLESYIYSPYKYRSYHPRFSAFFILNYTKHLEAIKLSSNPYEYIEEINKYTFLDSENTKTILKNKSLSFKFIDKTKKAKLLTIIKELTTKIDLLNIEKTSVEDFLNILLSDDILNEHYAIHLNCETTQFIYIINKLGIGFGKLNAKTIELSKSFYSKRGTLINAQNLYSNTIENPKEKATINSIINQMQ